MNKREWQKFRKEYTQDPGVVDTAQNLHNLLCLLSEEIEELIEMDLFRQLKRVISQLELLEELHPDKLAERERIVKRQRIEVDRELQDVWHEHDHVYAQEWSEHCKRMGINTDDL